MKQVEFRVQLNYTITTNGATVWVDEFDYIITDCVSCNSKGYSSGCMMILKPCMLCLLSTLYAIATLIGNIIFAHD